MLDDLRPSIEYERVDHLRSSTVRLAAIIAGLLCPAHKAILDHGTHLHERVPLQNGKSFLNGTF